MGESFSISVVEEETVAVSAPENKPQRGRPKKAPTIEVVDSVEGIEESELATLVQAFDTDSGSKKVRSKGFDEVVAPPSARTDDTAEKIRRFPIFRSDNNAYDEIDEILAYIDTNYPGVQYRVYDEDKENLHLHIRWSASATVETGAALGAAGTTRRTVRRDGVIPLGQSTRNALIGFNRFMLNLI